MYQRLYFVLTWRKTWSTIYTLALPATYGVGGRCPVTQWVVSFVASSFEVSRCPSCIEWSLVEASSFHALGINSLTACALFGHRAGITRSIEIKFCKQSFSSLIMCEVVWIARNDPTALHSSFDRDLAIRSDAIFPACSSSTSTYSPGKNIGNLHTKLSRRFCIIPALRWASCQLSTLEPHLMYYLYAG